MSLTAEERLIPVRVKVKRGKKHLADLEVAAEDYRDAYIHVVDSDAGYVLRRLPIIHFDMLAIAGDALHNLRSALDHVVYNLALVANPNVSDETLRTVAFPIGKSLEEYKTLRSRKLLQGVIEERAVRFIDSLKPYKRRGAFSVASSRKTETEGLSLL